MDSTAKILKDMIEEYYYNNSIFLEKYIERLKNIIPNEKD